jgi:hypothetical protein
MNQTAFGTIEMPGGRSHLAHCVASFLSLLQIGINEQSVYFGLVLEVPGHDWLTCCFWAVVRQHIVAEVHVVG